MKFTSNILSRNKKFLFQSTKNFSLFLKAKQNQKLVRLLEKESTIKVSFETKSQVSDNNYLFRFLLQDEEACLGVEPCQYINLQSTIPTMNNPEGELISKSYHPISLDTDTGFVDFLIKIYKDKLDNSNTYGLFSNYLANLEKGQIVQLTGPYGNLIYKEPGHFEIIEKDGKKREKKFKKLAMIAGGTGITPMFQLVRKIATNNNDATAISLIYASKTVEELTFCNDLSEFEQKGKLYFYPVVENVEISNWAFGKGMISKEILFHYLPSNLDNDSLVLICGPKIMTQAIKQMLSEMEFCEENIYSFS